MDNALTGGNQCDGVELDASRSYSPKSRTDATVAFPAGSLTFAIPAQIPVTAGSAGTGKAKFSFSLNGGPSTVCSYKGNGGNAYFFRRCQVAELTTPDADDDFDTDDGTDAASPIAGDTVTADTFALRVNRGDRKAGVTTAVLHIGGPTVDDGNACTVDACNPVDGVTHTPVNVDDANACTTDSCDPATGPVHTLVDTAFCRGQLAFDDATAANALGGNGRTCGTCHVASNAFQLSSATAEARYQAMVTTGDDDPLFRPIDANDFRTNGAAAHDFTNLRHGLVRVTMPLPANVKLVGTDGLVTSETQVDVWRAVPALLDVGLTGPDPNGLMWPASVPASVPRDVNGGYGPNRQGGYQYDARVDTLENQAAGALLNHSGTTMTAPSGLLFDIAEYERAQLAPASSTSLSDIETKGKAVFNRICSHCHGGDTGAVPIKSALAASGVPRYADITVDCPRPVDTASPARWAFKPCNANNGLDHLQQVVRTYEITMKVKLADGTYDSRTFRKSTSDPGRFLLTGYTGKPAVPGDTKPVGVPGPADDWSHYDIPSLRGVGFTAPYFHNNSAATLEEVVDQYEQFFKRTWYQNPNATFLTTTGPVNGVPNPDRLFGLGSTSCLTSPQAYGCPVPFGPDEKTWLVAYLKTL